MQRFHRVIHNLVVHRPSAHGMGVTDKRTVRGILTTAVDQRFQRTGWSS